MILETDRLVLRRWMEADEKSLLNMPKIQMWVR